MNKKILISLMLITMIFSSKIYSLENKILFKVNNKSFTTVDFETRKKYLEFIGDNREVDRNIILDDYISSIIFYEYYLNSKVNIDTDDKIEEIYNNILREVNNKPVTIKKNKILFNLKLDYIRKMILEDFLNSKRDEIFNKNEKNELIYDYKIRYITFNLKDPNFLEANVNYLDFNKIDDVKIFLENNNINFFEKKEEIKDINNINKNIKNNLKNNKYFFYIKNENIISFININKNFETFEGLIAQIYSLETNLQISKNDLNCQNLEMNSNSIVKEYEFYKLNNELKENLLNINDYIVFSNQDKLTYVVLCDIKFDEDILNNISINKKIQNIVESIEYNFTKKYSKQYNLIKLDE